MLRGVSDATLASTLILTPDLINLCRFPQVMTCLLKQEAVVLFDIKACSPLCMYWNSVKSEHCVQRIDHIIDQHLERTKGVCIYAVI